MSKLNVAFAVKLFNYFNGMGRNLNKQSPKFALFQQNYFSVIF